MDGLTIKDYIELVGMFGSIAFMLYRVGGFTKNIQKDMSAMEKELNNVKKVQETISTILTTIAVQKIELEHLRQEIKEVKYCQQHRDQDYREAG